jgi:hypothetical protein
MSSELQTVLEISAIGSTVLFAALAGLIGLMYLLTAQRLRRRAVRPILAEATDSDGAERARRARAIAIAVAVARAEAERPPAFEGSSEWRRVHRARQMDRPNARAASRRRR